MSLSITPTGNFVAEQVEIFTQVRPYYEDLCTAIEYALKKGVEKLGLYETVIQTRAKQVPSFAEKCIRKRKKYVHPAFQLTDLAGGRVIVPSTDDIPAICAYIRETFEIDEFNSENAGDRLADIEFGYQSVHFVVSLREGGDYGPKVPAALFKSWSAEEAKEIGPHADKMYKAEIQVRSLLQHAWSALLHDRMYKHDRTSTPHALIRESGRIAAGLENADAAFAALTARLDSFQSCYGAYMDAAKMDEELKVLYATSPHDAKNWQLALKIANLELARAQPREAHVALVPFAHVENATVQRVLGHAYWKAGNAEAAEQHLTRAVELGPDDADALCELGDFYFASAETRHLANENFRLAYREAPNSVRALRSYLFAELAHGRVDAIEGARPSLLQAIRTSQELVEVGIHVPHGHFDIGVCHLLLGNAHEALTAFVNGSHASASDEPLMELLRLLTVIQTHVVNRQPLERHMSWARSLLRALLVARAHARLDIALEAKERAEAALVVTKQSAELSAIEQAEAVLSQATTEAVAAEQARTKAQRSLLEQPEKPTLVPGEHRFGNDLELDGSKVFSGKRIVVVAGGCHASVERQIAEVAPLIHQAFAGYEGVVVSGGTRAGVAKLVGDLPSGPGLVKVGYLPAKVSSARPADGKYAKAPGQNHGYDVFRHTEENDYSPLEAIQLWLDLLCSGIKLGSVLVLGINGGRNSAFEYRLALAMGAKVGVLWDSGREASKIGDDPAWKSANGLLLLPTDLETIAAFLHPPRPLGLIDDSMREQLAEQTHAQFLAHQQSNSTKQDPRLMPWNLLIDSLKRSNYAQIADVERKLERLGLRLRSKSGAIRLYEFTSDQIDELARMEHGRWVIERLNSGWRLGSVKDPVARTNPNLISWDALPAAEKEYDISMARAIPTMLRGHANLEIYRPDTPE